MTEIGRQRMATHTFRIRCALGGAAVGALLLAFLKIPALSGGQAAVSLSRPGHEDLTFWVNHNGLSELDVHGEVGFGDMARILMRRRSNSERMRALRDRFTFKVREMEALDMPDLFRAELNADGLTWVGQPREIVLTQGRIFNLPVVVRNRTASAASVSMRYGSDPAVKGTVSAGTAAGYFLKMTVGETGVREGRVSITAGDRGIEAAVRADVRPVARLKVNVTPAGCPAESERDRTVALLCHRRRWPGLRSQGLHQPHHRHERRVLFPRRKAFRAGSP
jgi:hypothetical protein